MLDQLPEPVNYRWPWDFIVPIETWKDWLRLIKQLEKGETKVEQKQREGELKALRKIRDMLEEGRIGRALVLINREIQEKALLPPAHLPDEQGQAETTYDRTPATQREAEERATAEREARGTFVSQPYPEKEAGNES